MSEKYDAVAVDYESSVCVEQTDFPAFAFTQAMVAALEIRQLLTNGTLLAFTTTTGRNPRRVLELVKLDFHAFAQFV